MALKKKVAEAVAEVKEEVKVAEKVEKVVESKVEVAEEEVAEVVEKLILADDYVYDVKIAGKTFKGLSSNDVFSTIEGLLGKVDKIEIKKTAQV